MSKLDKLTAAVVPHLDPAESVLAAVQGSYETKIMGNDSVRSGIMAATEKRVVFYAKKLTGYDLESFPYENISSFEGGKNMMGEHVTFFSSGNKVHLKWVKGGNLAELITLVKGRMGKAPTAAAAPDITDQVRKLADLHAEGILSADEFQSKKAELLSRI